jgi:hypothetical protein
MSFLCTWIPGDEVNYFSTSMEKSTENRKDTCIIISGIRTLLNRDSFKLKMEAAGH